MRIRAVLVVAVLLVGSTWASPAPAHSTRTRSTHRSSASALTPGERRWIKEATLSESSLSPNRRINFGSNVDANDPAADLVPGQPAGSIAAMRSTVVVAWNDSTGLAAVRPTDPRASLTGLAVSTDRGRHFRDLTGLRNASPNQQWSGHPSVVAVDSRHFIIASTYLPSAKPDCSKGAPAMMAIAVEVLTLTSAGHASLGQPVVAAEGSDQCTVSEGRRGVLLDIPWIAYARKSRTLVLSYRRNIFDFGGSGQIELVRANVPRRPELLSSTSWQRPIVVWPEESEAFNDGAFVAVAPSGDAYVSWARTVPSPTPRDSYAYLHAARVPVGKQEPLVGGPTRPRIVSMGQLHSNGHGAVKQVRPGAIAGYNASAQSAPRIVVNARRRKVIVVWTDASAHPLGDVWLRALPLTLRVTGRIRRINDDRSAAAHLLPAVSVRSNGSIVTSWFDRRLGSANSARTDYFGEVRTRPDRSGHDFRISTGSTDWQATPLPFVFTPNFGEYTDNASAGRRTYFTWTDGRVGTPQPFVGHR